MNTDKIAMGGSQMFAVETHLGAHDYRLNCDGRIVNVCYRDATAKLHISAEAQNATRPKTVGQGTRQATIQRTADLWVREMGCKR